MNNKNPHEPNTLQSTAWALLKPVRQSEAKRRKKTKGAFGGKKKQ